MGTEVPDPQSEMEDLEYRVSLYIIFKKLRGEW